MRITEYIYSDMSLFVILVRPVQFVLCCLLQENVPCGVSEPALMSIIEVFFHEWASQCSSTFRPNNVKTATYEQSVFWMLPKHLIDLMVVNCSKITPVRGAQVSVTKKERKAYTLERVVIYYLNEGEIPIEKLQF